MAETDTNGKRRLILKEFLGLSPGAAEKKLTSTPMALKINFRT